MKIQVSLNQKSINDAIKQLKNAKKQLGVMVDEFITECCIWFINRANQHLLNSDIGRNVVQDIIEHWSFTVKDGKGLIVNDSDSAVFVEFGVGQVGGEIPHPMASQLGYQYDVQSNSKFTSQDGGHYWIYHIDSEDDIDQHPNPDMIRQTRSGMFMITRGSWGELYAYTTLNDLQIEQGVLKGLWQKIKIKYWGN